MDTILIFTATVSGHNMEYLHHIYDAAIHNTNQRYIFVVPEEFEQVKHNFVWEFAKHISFDYFTKEESASWQNKGMLASSYYLCKLVRNRIKKHKADKLFVVTLMSHLPFAPFMYGWRVKMSGIIYKIYLHEWHRSSFLSKVMDVLKYMLMRIFPLFDRVYILNDATSATRLNRLYRTTKFSYLPDPYVPLTVSESALNLREELGVKANQKLFIHFGALAERKGTIQIIDSLQFLSKEECERYVFVFAGRVFPDIKEAFYAGVAKYQSSVCIHVKDEFCSFEYLAALCDACDAILMPYLETAQSSGVIGYAAQFGKPVIAPDEGLVGQLVQNYQLGITCNCSAESLAGAYQYIADGQMPFPSQTYCKDHRVIDFQLFIQRAL